MAIATLYHWNHSRNDHRTNFRSVNEADLYIEKIKASDLRRVLVNEGFQHVPLYDDYGILGHEDAEDVSGFEEMRKLIETGDISAIYSVQIL